MKNEMNAEKVVECWMERKTHDKRGLSIEKNYSNRYDAVDPQANEKLHM